MAHGERAGNVAGCPVSVKLKIPELPMEQKSGELGNEPILEISGMRERERAGADIFQRGNYFIQAHPCLGLPRPAQKLSDKYGSDR